MKQGSSLGPLYPIVYLDCLYTKIRESGSVKTKMVYLSIGVNLEGHKGGLPKKEGAKFWQQVITELNNRGVNDILIAAATAPASMQSCVDGLRGIPEAIETVFPQSRRATLHCLLVS